MQETVNAGCHMIKSIIPRRCRSTPLLNRHSPISPGRNSIPHEFPSQGKPLTCICTMQLQQSKHLRSHRRLTTPNRLNEGTNSVLSLDLEHAAFQTLERGELLGENVTGEHEIREDLLVQCQLDCFGELGRVRGGQRDPCTAGILVL